MSKTIVIVGVTGIQGSSVAHTFLRLPGWKVRGITRKPSSPAAQALATKGVEIVQADLDDKQSLLPAFEGANVIFSNTDFFGHLQDALFGGNISLGARSPNEYAFDREVEQGLNIAEAAASPTVLKTLERFVLSSLSDARKLSGGKYTYVYHNDAKAEIIRATQAQFPEVAARTSTVQVGHYVTNWKASPPLMPQKQPDGSFVVQRTFGPKYKIPFVVAHEDTGEFVKVLVDLPPGKDLLGVSEHMTWPAWTKLWGDTLGVKASFKQVSEDEYFTGVPDALRKELAETFAYVEEFGYTGGDPNVLTAEEIGIEVSLTSMKDYIKREDWSSVL
ncbi:putative hscarg dehydrogenase [Talaromyces proteolyticus]|uniref:Hscarg dehydrogenase n=1 Tax=Talaromyces proteolyticus TaxID=1131652 RepID=A0AAD4L3X4_9EURO|nr:putative hscarg dehydrogenase [Talaromyces proteolyticus]KAH8705487.1 putative hscarg dehydrogenase [Talaromyces proteolyticus]